MFSSVRLGQLSLISILLFWTIFVTQCVESHPIVQVWDVQRRDPKGQPICIQLDNATGRWKCSKTAAGREYTWASRNHGRPVMLGIKSNNLTLKAGVSSECPMVTSTVNSICIHSSRPFMYGIWSGSTCHEMLSVDKGCYYAPAVCGGTSFLTFELWVDNNLCSSTNVTIDSNFCAHVSFLDRLNSKCIGYLPWLVIITCLVTMSVVGWCLWRWCRSRIPFIGLSDPIPMDETNDVISQDEAETALDPPEASQSVVQSGGGVTINVQNPQVPLMGSQPYHPSSGWLPRKACLLLCMPLFMLVSADCYNPYAVQGQLIECTDYSDYDDCSIIFQTELSLTQLGRQSCLSVTDQNATVSLTIGIESFTSTFKPEYLYSTGWWQPSIFTRRKCTGTTGCPSYYCNYDVHDCSLGLEPDNVTGKACEWFCEVSGASPGCFTAYGCYRSSYNLDSDCAVDVYSLTPSSTEIRLNVNGQNQLLQEASYEDDSVSVTLLGSLAGNEVSVPSSARFLCVDKRTNYAYFCDASGRQHPAKNKIGDIQCSAGSIVDWDRNILVRRYIKNQQTYMEFTKPGWSTDRTRIQLPHSTPDVLWMHDASSSRLKAVHKLLSAPVRVMVTSGTNLRARRSKAEVCPKIHSTSYGGCKFCADGAYACANISSTCYAGDGWLTTGSNSLAIHLETTSHEVCIPIIGNESMVVLTVSSLKHSASAEFHPVLDLKDTLINTTNGTNIDTWLKYQQSLVVASSWFKWLLVGAITVIAVVIGLYILRVILVCLSKSKLE